MRRAIFSRSNQAIKQASKQNTSGPHELRYFAWSPRTRKKREAADTVIHQLSQPMLAQDDVDFINLPVGPISLEVGELLPFMSACFGIHIYHIFFMGEGGSLESENHIGELRLSLETVFDAYPPWLIRKSFLRIHHLTIA